MEEGRVPQYGVVTCISFNYNDPVFYYYLLNEGKQNMKGRNPRTIPNNFRLQFYIEEVSTEANELYENKNWKEYNNETLVDMALAFLETAKGARAEEIAQQVLKNLEQSEEKKDNANEQKATALYILATRHREANRYDEANQLYNKGIALNPSPWLMSNIYRNQGLVYLSQEKYDEACKIFNAGVEYLKKYIENNPELEGSLTAMQNYKCLADLR